MHCHPGTFLLSRHSRTFEIHPNHQSESSRVGKGNGCPWALFPRESVFCQMLRRCSTGLCSCCLWVPFSTAEGTEWLLALILLNLIGSRTGWSLIFWSLQLMSACVCVCSCICVHMCVRLRSACFVPCHEYLLLLPDHIYAPVSSEITFSYFQSRGDSGHCLPPSCLLWPGAGVDTGLHPDHRAYWHFWWNYWIRAVFIASGDADLVQYKPGIAGHHLFTTRRWPI